MGSHYYAKSLTAADLRRPSWLSHADRQLPKLAGQTSAASKLPIHATNVEKIGTDDTESFGSLNTPTITFHSLTQQTWSILHTHRDTFHAIRVDDYCDSYRLLAAYLAFADSALAAGVR